jgi:glutathione synthase/RimK-type ligase-like ATP-grasp enzyme
LADIALLYDQSETDELGIKLTADEMSIKLGFIPFYKTVVAFNHDKHKIKSIGKDFTETLDNTRVILNRTQSKSRRLFASTIMESFGKEVLNPQSVELFCQSKVKTLLAFASHNIKVPYTVYVSCNVHESLDKGQIIDNSDIISNLIESELGENVVLKPDAGTHGRGVSLARTNEELINLVSKSTVSITNPSGVLAQELIDKWFYDLRILVSKKKGEQARCHETALSRGGFMEFRTNTFLGNKVIRANLPIKVKNTAKRCAEVLGKGQDAWLIALDAMPFIPSELQVNTEELKDRYIQLDKPFKEVTRVKARSDKRREFKDYTNAITAAYTNYMKTEAYCYIESVVNDTLRKTADNVYFHEGNACPEFWEQTRVVAGINPAIDLLESSQSLLDR